VGFIPLFRGFITIIMRDLIFAINSIRREWSRNPWTANQSIIGAKQCLGRRIEALYDLYSSPNNIRVIKSSRTRWEGHVDLLGDRCA